MKTDEIFVASDTCRYGEVLLAATKRGICALFLGDDLEAQLSYLLEALPECKVRWTSAKSDSFMRLALRHIEKPNDQTEISLDLQGTPFQMEVWRELMKIPFGSTISYAELARRVGRPGAYRAVAHACGSNMVSVIVPCHRVVGSNGALTGYRWGVSVKSKILEREAEILLERRVA